MPPARTLRTKIHTNEIATQNVSRMREGCLRTGGEGTRAKLRYCCAVGAGPLKTERSSNAVALSVTKRAKTERHDSDSASPDKTSAVYFKLFPYVAKPVAFFNFEQDYDSLARSVGTTMIQQQQQDFKNDFLWAQPAGTSERFFQSTSATAVYTKFDFGFLFLRLGVRACCLCVWSPGKM